MLPLSSCILLSLIGPSFQSVVDDVIDYMDEYYLSKEDWDTIVELGVGDSKDDKVLKKISTATKTTFTKKSVVSSHICFRLILTIIYSCIIQV